MNNVRSFINGLSPGEFRKRFSAVRSSDAFAKVMTFPINVLSSKEKEGLRKQLIGTGIESYNLSSDAVLEETIRIIGGKMANDWANARESKE
jgi:hypothetical protein